MSTPKPYSCRLGQSDQEKIENAVEETGLSLSAILRRSFHHYARTNPDRLSTFGESHQAQEAKRSRKIGPRPGEHSRGSQNSDQDVSTDSRPERGLEVHDEVESEHPLEDEIYQPTKEEALFF